MPTDYSAYYSTDASAVLNASVAAESRTTVSTDGALDHPTPECPFHAEAAAFIGTLGIDEYRATEADQCYCDRCYAGPDMAEGRPGLVAPRGWVKFGITSPTDGAVSDWASSFYGVSSKPVLRRALHNGHVLAPSEALQDGNLLDENQAESPSDLLEQATSDASLRLRAFYRMHSPEHEDKVELLAERFAYDLGKLNKELRKRYAGADLSAPLFLHECRGRATNALWTSPTIKYAGLKYYARPQEYGKGTYGEYASERLMAASMAFECRQRPGSFDKGPETMGFRRLAMQNFPGWDKTMDQEWSLANQDEVEWAAHAYNPEDIQLTALMVRVFSAADVPESTEHEKYRSPLDEEYRPLLAQWNNFMSTRHNTTKAAFKPDKASKQCEECGRPFGRTMDPRGGPQYRRRHHCRACGGVFCNTCSAHKVEDVPGYLHDKPQRVCEGCYYAMFHLGSLEQRRFDEDEPELLLVPPSETAAAVAAAALSHSNAVWVVGGKLEVFSKKASRWYLGTIRSLPRSDLVEIVYTVDGENSAKVPRLKLCESRDCTLQFGVSTTAIDALTCASYRIVAERSSPRLRWPNGLSGVTSKPDQVLRTVTVTVNGNAKLGLNFGTDGRTFPVVESIEPNSLMAMQCPNVERGMIVTEVEGAQFRPAKVEKMSAQEAAQVFVAVGRPVTVTLRRP